MALEHLHFHMPDMFIVHRDLKPDNVGFKADGTLKLVSLDGRTQIVQGGGEGVPRFIALCLGEGGHWISFDPRLADAQIEET